MAPRPTRPTRSSRPSALDALKQKTGKLLMNVKPFMVEGAYSQFHPLLQSVRENQHLEPVIPRAQQQAQARGRLAEWTQRAMAASARTS